MNTAITTSAIITYGLRMTIRSCNRMSLFSASVSVENISSPASLRLSEMRLGRTTKDATLIPHSEPSGLNACARFRRLVAVSFAPNDNISGLAVVSRKANPNVSI